MHDCCVRLFPVHVFYRCGLIAGYIHARSGNLIYYIRAGMEGGLGFVVGFYMRLLRSALVWVFVF